MSYDQFIRSALNAGFTDDQVNWLEHYLYKSEEGGDITKGDNH